MESFIRDYKDHIELLSNVATIIGAIALLIGVYSYNLTKKQLNFSVLNRCITHFSENFASISDNSDRAKLKEYIDFVNEELFYFEKEYIPKDVALEWIDGMIDYMPIYNNSTPPKLLNPDKAIKNLDDPKLLKDYQRVKKAFTVKGEYKPNLIYSDIEGDAEYKKRRNERERLAKEIYENLK